MSARVPSPTGTDSLARKLESAVVARIGAARYGLWFQRHTAFVFAGRDLVVCVASTNFQDWLEQTFGEVVRAAACEVCGAETRVSFVVDADLFQQADEAKPTPAEQPAAAPKPAGKSPAEPARKPAKTLFGDSPPLPPSPPRGKKGAKTTPAAPAEEIPRPTARTAARRYKLLADFVVGPSNRVAHASALSVVEEPGQGANPLVIHGPVGTGKTHLLEGTYAGFRRTWPDSKPCLVTAEEFTTRFVQAARFGKQSAFRRQFRDCSALLLDDLHFLATKRATQEEFLHTFDALVADGRQVVVTMDCHPRLAEELMPELADRLLGGAVWGLLPPDATTRLEILRKKATGNGPAIPDEVLKFLAQHLKGNVRELEGAVNGVRHFARVTGRVVDTPLAREALGDLLRHAVRAVTVGEVDVAVCAVLRLSVGTLQSKARSWAVSHPRMLAIYLARKHTSATYGEISTHFGAKTHSTAVAAEKKVRGWVRTDEALALGDREWGTKDLIDRIERELQR
ncbi:DnaA ATPase domain-containing protein [Fimbriiglobus ruber]|uniref:Chromosomal replication initiator protein DnaA n=1 Tax=Fimbriiglobus ruber TaxID=1908690 RepID=A0A225DPD9_9BACT|nr:DnaA/Hda family protein [Fimbriiglobus ruber]OWK43340.1 Chromosomal replication initiator protein DnaA [Fimbriiglobus ruber]